MSKLKYLLLFLLFAISGKYDNVYALSETSTYAKALPECVLYKTASLEYNIENVYFIVHFLPLHILTHN